MMNEQENTCTIIDQSSIGKITRTPSAICSEENLVNTLDYRLHGFLPSKYLVTWV